MYSKSSSNEKESVMGIHMAGIFPKYLGVGVIAVRFLWQRQSRTCAFPCVNTVL